MLFKQVEYEYGPFSASLREALKTNLKFKDMSTDEIDSFISRVERAQEVGLSLPKEDMTLLIDAFKACIFLQEKISANDLTIVKLKKLLGMVKASEGRPSEDGKSKSKRKRPRRKKPRKPKKRNVADFAAANKIQHQLNSLENGASCPECGLGRVYKYEPSILVRITGHAPFEVTIHEKERLRCNACGEFFTAKLPQQVLQDGPEGQRFGYSARSLMAISKYGAGSPFHRQQDLQKILGVPISASSIFDQCEKVADAAFSIHKYLQSLAGTCGRFFIDDTHHRIIESQSVISERTGKEKSGVYATVVIGINEANQQIVLFKTNVGHAGDYMDLLLQNRPSDLPLPLVMSDALSSNRISAREVRRTLCNVHCRRQFYDLLDAEPSIVNKILNLYGQVFDNETESIDHGFDFTERLDYHQKKSLPIMEEMHAYINEQVDNKTFEPNSLFGKARSYMNNHWEGLTAFCRWEGASLENNQSERVLKLIVLGRKNHYFYKTQMGANVSDIITSLIATCKFADINPFLYFNAIQQNHSQTSTSPHSWLPWNFQNNFN